MLKNLIFGKEDGKTLFEKIQDGKKEKIKKDLPLSIRFNSLVEVSGLDRKMILSGNKLKFPKMESKRTRIASIGIVNLSDDLEIYRAYLQPEFSEEDYIYFIEIECKKDNVQSVKIFGKVDEIFPDSVDTWSQYLDGDTHNSPYIGGLTLNFNDIEYYRIWDKNADISQHKFIEKFYSTEIDSEDLQNISALYAREISDNFIEYLYITAIEEQTQEAYIEVYIGVELKISDLKIT